MSDPATLRAPEGRAAAGIEGSGFAAGIEGSGFAAAVGTCTDA
jgi:hypothetical protein